MKQLLSVLQKGTKLSGVAQAGRLKSARWATAMSQEFNGITLFNEQKTGCSFLKLYNYWILKYSLNYKLFKERERKKCIYLNITRYYYLILIFFLLWYNMCLFMTSRFNSRLTINRIHKLSQMSISDFVRSDSAQFCWRTGMSIKI